MAGPNPYKLHSFKEWQALVGTIYIVCYGGCQRYSTVSMAKHGDRDTRRTTFSCCLCGTAGRTTAEKPHESYREDARANPRHHPRAIARFTGRLLRPSRALDLQSRRTPPGELPGRRLPTH